MYACMYVCMRVRTHTCAYNVCIHVCASVCLYMCIYTYIHVIDLRMTANRIHWVCNRLGRPGLQTEVFCDKALRDKRPKTKPYLEVICFL